MEVADMTNEQTRGRDGELAARSNIVFLAQSTPL